MSKAEEVLNLYKSVSESSTKSYPEAKKDEKVYVDKDEEDGQYHIFGSDSGHSYGYYYTNDEAIKAMNEKFPKERHAK